MPHSSAGKAESGSAIADMEHHQDMYPRIIRMNAGTTLKITKSGFRETLKTLLHENYI
jgi:hypothetical protein